MAFATFFLNWIGSFARFYTVLVEADKDGAFVTQAAVAIGLTTTIMIQFFIFRKNTQRRLVEL